MEFCQSAVLTTKFTPHWSRPRLHEGGVQTEPGLVKCEQGESFLVLWSVACPAAKQHAANLVLRW